MKFWETFVSLPRPSAPGAFIVEPGAKRFRVARTFEDHAALLVEFPKDGGSSVPRRLATLSYSPPTLLDLTTSDGRHHTARLAVLECRDPDPLLSSYFLRVVSAVLVDEAIAQDEVAFESALDALATLFRTLQRPGLRPLQGLWAELAIILWAADPIAALTGWHSSPRALYDFSAGSFRLEVKATQRPVREHTFLLDQLGSQSPGATLIASFMLHEAEDGASVFDLVEGIVTRIGGLHGPAARLEAIVAESVGNCWREANDVRFSLSGARLALQMYLASDVPTIPQPLPPAIKEVRYTVDLSTVEALPLARARALGDLFARLLPGEAPPAQ
jgi:hypothetical protein